jgi:hypothetical protein
MERSVIHIVSSSIAGAILYGGSLFVAPAAQAGTLTFGYSNGSFDASATVDPDLGQAINLFLGQSLPSSFSVSGANLGGTFTVLDDPAQFTDGDVTIDYAFLDTILGSYIDSYKASVLTGPLLPLAGLSDAQFLAALDSIFDYSLTGSGTLSNSNGGSTNFAVNYVKASKSIIIDGFDTTIASSCLNPTLTCTTTASGNFGLSVSAGGLVSVANQLGLPIPSQISTIPPAFLTGLSLPLLTNGSFNYGAKTSLLSSNPTSTTLSGNLTDGTITTTQTLASGAVNVTARNLAATNNIQSVPEPATGLVFLGAGIANIWKRRRKAA